MAKKLGLWAEGNVMVGFLLEMLAENRIHILDYILYWIAVFGFNYLAIDVHFFFITRWKKMIPRILMLISLFLILSKYAFSGIISWIAGIILYPHLFFS